MSLQTDLTNTRQELDNQQAERAGIGYVIFLAMPGCTSMLLTYDLFRKLHVEADEKLQNIYYQLLQVSMRSEA